MSDGKPATDRLRPHQREAVSKILTVLASSDRATLVAACGTGKTWIGATVAVRLTRDPVLIAVPTLDLVGQTVASWRQRGHTGPIVTVCSDEELLHASRGRADSVTTSAAELAAAISRDPAVVVVATYASLGVLIEAHHNHGAPTWGLAIIDEAHRTSGRLGKPWAAIHNQKLIPALRRLYMTATPRIIDADGTVMASMDDEAIYGPVAYRLSMGDAIKVGILADYQVLVPVVQGGEISRLIIDNPAAATPSLVNAPADELALAVGLLRAAGERNLEKIVSYHSRVTAARSFARTFEAAADLLPAEQRPDAVWARAIWGKQSVAARREQLERFRNGEGVHLVANSRVLTEGVDVPDIDAVVFADAKSSVIDIVQAIGRALRPKPDPTKNATIVIPVFTQAGHDLESALGVSAWAPLWKTLRALRAHDGRLMDWLTPKAGSGQPQNPKEDGPADLSWLHVTGAPLPEDFAAAVQLAVVDHRSAEFQRGLSAARRYHRDNGHINAPQGFVDDNGFALGSWVSWQRYLFSIADLSEHRKVLLEGLGISWKPRASAVDYALELAARYVAANGHLAIVAGEKFEDFELGTWVHNRRNRSGPASDRLGELDPMWNPTWPGRRPVQWRRGFYRARDWIQATGICPIPRTAKDGDGFTVGEWWHAQQVGWSKLHEEQQRMLVDLGMDPAAEGKHRAAFKSGYASAERFHGTHGHLEVPQSYVDPEGFRLGTWINNKRRRADAVSDSERALLDKLGMRWSTPRVSPPPFSQPE